MANQCAAPSEADAPRPWARAILHARIPAALKLLLLALFGAFAIARSSSRTRHALRQDWLFSTNTGFTDDLDSAQDEYALRRILQLRAEIGWLLRGKPGKGMSPSGHRAPEPCPAQSARAPPAARFRPQPPRIRRENPASRGGNPRPYILRYRN